MRSILVLVFLVTVVKAVPVPVEKRFLILNDLKHFVHEAGQQLKPVGDLVNTVQAIGTSAVQQGASLLNQALHQGANLLSSATSGLAKTLVHQSQQQSKKRFLLDTAQQVVQGVKEHLKPVGDLVVGTVLKANEIGSAAVQTGANIANQALEKGTGILSNVNSLVQTVLKP